MPTREQRFWSRVNREGPVVSQEHGPCWLWLGFKLMQRGGYGQFNDWPRVSFAHRVSWELTYGKVPDGLSVLHRCDNPPCVRPEHLWIGTQADNVADMVRKGRSLTGIRHPAYRHGRRVQRKDQGLLRAKDMTGR
jgi:hypothetical protein